MTTKKNRSGTLGFLASILLVSAVLRVDFTSVQASEPAPIPQESPKDSLELALQAVQSRQDEISQKEEQLAERERLLQITKQEIETKLSELEAAEVRVSELLALADTAAEDDLARLTAVYENMKPKDAARVFSEMAPEFAAGFLARMSADAAAKVMAGLDPKLAYQFSAIVAARNAKSAPES